MRLRNQARNDEIFTACLDAARKYTALGRKYGVSSQRIEQVFKREATARYPAIVATIEGGAGFRIRFVEALREQAMQRNPTLQTSAP